MNFPKLISTGVLSAMICTPTVMAQQSQQEPPIARECFEDLKDVSEKIVEEGFWGAAWGPRGGPRLGYSVPPGPAMETERLWNWGVRTPSFQIRTLHSSAHVLALRGEQDACDMVLAELTELYDQYVQDLREAGVDPGELVNWRQEMLAGARPVEELPPEMVSLNNVTGTEIRNPQDQYLGTIDDIIAGPDQQPRYVLVSRGGFLGIGGDHTVVPWEALSASPGMQMFLLNAPEEVIAQAPEVDPERIGDSEVLAQRRDEFDQYWQQHIEEEL